MSLQIQLKNKSHLRPSKFLNEFDLNTLMISPKLKGSQNDLESPPIKVDEKQKKFLRRQVTILPSIQEQIKQKKNDNEEKTSYDLSNNSTIHLVLKQTLTPVQETKLPILSQIQSPRLDYKIHKRNLTDQNLPTSKKVEFRPSILVIDFVNDILKKDVIDGSSKPLTKRLQRQKTRFLPSIQKA